MIDINLLLTTCALICLYLLYKYQEKEFKILSKKLKDLDDLNYNLNLVLRTKNEQIEIPLKPKNSLIRIRKMKSLGYALIYEENGKGYFVQSKGSFKEE